MSDDYVCYKCGTPLEKISGTMGWCPLDKFWVDKPWEPRSEMPRESAALEGR